MPKSKKQPEEVKETAEKKDNAEVENSSFVVKGKAIVSFFRSDKFKFTTAVLFVFFAAFLTISFVSYLFTWKADQSVIDLNWFSLLTDSNLQVENWAGKTGALIANNCIHDWFGIASFSIVFILFIMGFRLFGVVLLPLLKSIQITVILTVWASVLLGYFFADSYFFVGGAHGFHISKWLNSFIGVTGTAFLLTIFIAGFVFFTVDNAVAKIKNLIASLNVRKAEEIDSVETEKSADGENVENDKDLEENQDTEEEIQIIDETEEDDAEADEENLEDEDASIEDEKTDVDEFETISKDIVFETTPLPEKAEDYVLTVEKTEDDLVVEQISTVPKGDYDPTLDLSFYKMPPIDLLLDHKSSNSDVTEDELNENKNKIIETLKNYKIDIAKIKATIGPTVTLYEIVPAPGVRISKIKNLEDDIALSLSALGIRIIAPIPGKGTIGIEVPNQKPEIVSMRSAIVSKKFQDNEYELPVALGKTISNETYVFDLCKMPHLLVAGATGQGKSVGLNAILASLLYKKHPSQLKFVMIDPKKVELTMFSRIEKHYLAKIPNSDDAIITDTQKVINTLNSLTVEMDNRYDLLKKASAKTIVEYNNKFVKRSLNPDNGHRFLPYIVVVIDEFADLIMTAGKEIETPIARIAQLARAVGIHLIIATQRPSTNIITGTIKANFPARIAFRVTSMIDSRTILDTPGANQLIGRGDMLISQGSNLVRVQCAFIDTPEIERLTEYIAGQQSYPSAYMLPEFKGDDEGGVQDIDMTKRDPMFDDAARLIVTHQQGSTSLIQRKFAIGYNRAGRIMDQLEAAGIVGPFEGSKARQVLYTDLNSLEQYLNSLSSD
jgi:DNA segregation ATPase FtsK/SpoIIIE, S-DNA-T family